MRELWIDFETRSEKNLKEVGLYNYATADSTAVLLLAYSFDREPVQLWVTHEGPMPDELAEALADPFITKWAHNSSFERLILKHVLKIDVPISEWRDTQVLARYFSLPGALEDISEILGLGEDAAKIKDGKRLIKLFCEPFIDGGEQTLFGVSEAAFKDHRTNPEDWALFEEYCRQDVRAEIAVAEKLKDFPLPEHEWAYWEMDARINDFGVPVDGNLIEAGLQIVETEQNRLSIELKELTGVSNPNSDDQLKGFLKTRGYSFSGLGKGFVNRALAGELDLTPEAKRALELRAQLSKSGVDKLYAIKSMVAPDFMLRNQFSFMGAARTGRYASQGINIQNLARPVKEVNERLEEAIALILGLDYEGIKKAFKAPTLDVVSSCLRPVFKAPEGSRLIIADLNAIENRVAGWIARCQAILDVFLGKDDFGNPLCPYKSFAVELYKKPYNSITKEERNIAKVAVLAAAYRMGGGDEFINSEGERTYTGLLAYAKNFGIEMSKEMADKAILVFRQKYKEVKQFWYDLEDAFVGAVRDGEETEVGVLRFKTKNNVLQMFLPSGRALHYLNPRIVENTVVQGRTGEYTKTALYYDGQDQVTRQWVQVETHGGKICEQACQSLARDILMVGMQRADRAGFKICLHVHDELVAVVPYSSHLTVKDLENCMTNPIDWGIGLPLGAAGFESIVYRKE